MGDMIAMQKEKKKLGYENKRKKNFHFNEAGKKCV